MASNPTPPWPAGPYYVIDWNGTWATPSKPVPARPTCADCQRELVHELDAYYGRDPWCAARCVKCRRGRG